MTKKSLKRTDKKWLALFIRNTNSVLFALQTYHMTYGDQLTVTLLRRIYSGLIIKRRIRRKSVSGTRKNTSSIRGAAKALHP
jgi:hypothetical protein